MKRFISIFLLCLLVGCSTMNDEGGLELQIIHTNDTHAYLAGLNEKGNPVYDEKEGIGGFSRIAKVIREAKEQNDNVIALDAGDQFQGSLFYGLKKWKAISKVHQTTLWDAMTLGNHEFDEGCQELSQFIEETPVPVLMANMRIDSLCPLFKHYRPFIIKEIRGTRIGIIGIANDEVRTLSRACEHTHFKNPMGAIQETIDILRKKGVHHVIAITHLGLEKDKELAKQIDGIDVIVGGHSHSYLGPDSSDGDYPLVVYSPSQKPVVIVTAKCATEYIGRLLIRFNLEGEPIHWQGALYKNDQAFDIKTSEIIQNEVRNLARYNNEVIGENQMQGKDGMYACRKGNCLVATLTTEAMLDFAKDYGAQIALINGGAIRAAMPYGPISKLDLLAVHPFGNRYVLRVYKGENLLKALELGVKEKVSARLLHAAGLRYWVNPQNPVGSRITKVEFIHKDGKKTPFNQKAYYRVVLPDFLVEKGHLTPLQKGKPLALPQKRDVEVLEAYIRKNTPLLHLKRENILNSSDKD